MNEINPRQHYVNLLGPHIEGVIFNHVYLKASNENISLYWNDIFRDIYIAYAERIVRNIEMHPSLRDELTQSTDFMSWPDIRMNDRWHGLIQQDVTPSEAKYSEDHVCGLCKAKKIRFRVMNLRSLDEGSSMVFRCDNCGHTWTQN